MLLMVLLMVSKRYIDDSINLAHQPCMHITSSVAYFVRPRRLSPLSLNFLISAFHGSHTDPYFLSSRVSSIRCSFCKDTWKCQNSPLAACYWGRSGRTRNTHKVHGFLAAIHIGKYFFQLMTFQALGMLESAHDILFQPVFQLGFLRIGPPPAVLEKELITRNGVINPFTILDLLPLTVGKRVVRCRVMTNSVDPTSESAKFLEEKA